MFKQSAISNLNCQKKKDANLFSPVASVREHTFSGWRLEVGVSFVELISVSNCCQLFSSLSGTAGVPFVKAVNASGRIDQFLLAGEKRMTRGANFDVQIVAHRRACLKCAAAGTDH